jgi:hypothetical protein
MAKEAGRQLYFGGEDKSSQDDGDWKRGKDFVVSFASKKG